MACWTVSRAPEHCGMGGCTIAPGEPIYSLLNGKQLRCQTHAHEPVDWDEVKLEQWRLDEERRREIAARLHIDPPPPRPRPPLRWRKPQPPAPADAVRPSYDPRARAANDYE